MSFKEIANKRYSCRSYEKKPVERALLADICETAMLSPSACNSQPWHFIVADTPEIVKEIPPLLQTGGFNSFCNDVPAFIVLCETPAKVMSAVEERTGNTQFYAQMDIGIAAATLCYAASDAGLSTCIIGWFERERLRSLLSIPENECIRLVLAVGYAKNEAPQRRPRKDKSEVITYNNGL